MERSLAENLRVLRARRGLTLTEAAQKAGVQRQTLALLERGDRHPHMPTLTKIANGYGVPVEDLLEEPVRPKAQAPDLGALSPEARRILRRLLESRVDAGVPWSVRDILTLRDEFGQRFGFSNEEFASWLEQAGGAEESPLADTVYTTMDAATARRVAGLGSEDDAVHGPSVRKTQPPR